MPKSKDNLPESENRLPCGCLRYGGNSVIVVEGCSTHGHRTDPRPAIAPTVDRRRIARRVATYDRVIGDMQAKRDRLAARLDTEVAV